MESSGLDENEVVAETFLQSLDLNPHFEPKGPSTFPDFEIDDGRVGIEVRVLMPNQEGASADPLATVSNSIWTRTQKCLASIKRADLPASYWVRLQFKRPLPKWSTIENAVRAHLERPIEELCSSKRAIAKNVSISVGLGDEKRDRPFLFGGNSDLDDGRFVVASMIENISYAITDKTKTERKRANSSHGYERLWLILVNRIDSYLTLEEMDEIRAEIAISPPWERIILIDPDAAALVEWIAQQGATSFA